MRLSFLSALALFAIASPAAALLGDHEPSNDIIATTAIQLVPDSPVASDGGMFALTIGGGDIDFIGIGGLLAGDVVTVLTTPLVDAPDFEIPDTIVGVFDSAGTELCEGDDAFNNDLDNFPTGFGSLCRLQVPADGDYYVAATGFSVVPFDGSHLEEGAYSLTVSVTVLPEPGLLLQLVFGALGVVVLDKHRRGVAA